MSKMNTVPILIAAVIVIVVLIFSTCTYVIDEREQAVVTRLNRPITVIVGENENQTFEEAREAILELATREEGREDSGVNIADDLKVVAGAGLRFKLPFNIDKVDRFPDVVMEYDAEPREIVLADKKKLVVDNYARWRVINPLLYRVRVQNERNARERLDDIIYSIMRAELGKNPLIEVIRTTDRYAGLSDEEIVEDLESVQDDIELEAMLSDQNPMREEIRLGRETIMKTVTELSDARARALGIQILDVRIKRADLLQENLEAVFGRMQAERKRISEAYRSEGHKEANIIRGETDRQVQVIAANAERDAKMLQGEGDAQAIQLVSEAFGTNSELYRFMRSLEVLQDSTPQGSEFVIGLDSGIFKLLRTETGTITP